MFAGVIIDRWRWEAGDRKRPTGERKGRNEVKTARSRNMLGNELEEVEAASTHTKIDSTQTSEAIYFDIENVKRGGQP